MADVILHNRPEGTPSDNEFVAYGTPTTPSGQIKMSNFYNLLMSKLGFFKVSNLFSEIFGNQTAMAAARANIGVSSTAENTTALNLKAYKSNVIEKDSTVAFTPTIGTHPVNLKVIQDKFYTDGLVFVFGDVAGTTARQVTIGKTMPNTNYMVFLEFQSTQLILPNAIVNKTTTTFDVVLAEEGSQVNDVRFRWFLIAY